MTEARTTIELIEYKTYLQGTYKNHEQTRTIAHLPRLDNKNHRAENLHIWAAGASPHSRRCAKCVAAPRFRRDRRRRHWGGCLLWFQGHHKIKAQIGGDWEWSHILSEYQNMSDTVGSYTEKNGWHCKNATEQPYACVSGWWWWFRYNLNRKKPWCEPWNSETSRGGDAFFSFRVSQKTYQIIPNSLISTKKCFVTTKMRNCIFT